ncbi:uncharacterized protein V3H82_019571 [Fundulus diaphanus]
MAGLYWIALFLCAAGCHQSPTSHISISTLEVKRGQNVSLTCNVTASSTVTWYLLRSDQLLPLMRVSKSKLRSGNDVMDYSSVNPSHVMWTGNLKTGLVRLEIEAAEEVDAGLYFCSGWCGAKVYGSRGIYLKFKGIDGEGRKLHPPFGSHWICVLSGLFGLFSFLMIGLYLCSGKLGHCCCNPWRQDSTMRVTEDDSLHYSSLRHPDKPRPFYRAAPGLVEDLVTYSTVATRQKN